MSEGYKFYFTDVGYVIPDDVKGKSSIVAVDVQRKPEIKQSLSKDIHEVNDNWPFYTSTPGKYNVITYNFNDIQLVKYKPLYGLKYQVCIKSSNNKLIYSINNKTYNVVATSIFDINSVILDFDTEDFFDYNFQFCRFEETAYTVLYHTINKILFARIGDMAIEIGLAADEMTAIGKLTDKLYVCHERAEFNELTKEPYYTDLKNFKDDAGILCFELDREKKTFTSMIWSPASQAYMFALNDERDLKCLNKFNLVPIKNFTKTPTATSLPEFEILKVYSDNKLVTANNELAPSTTESFRRLVYNSNNFGTVASLNTGGFDFMIKIHRNIIRNLYAKYLYVDVLDVGIGKCRDVHAYQRYINRFNIHGVEPNKDFSKFCTIKNIYTNTADGIFKFFKLKRMTNKFHTIIFCNSYNFVTDPYITMKECEEYLSDGGRIIMVYMNNDKVITVKNNYYEIRKGEKNPDLPADHVLSGRQNFIQVFSETTLVPPHYENQISESDITDAMNKVNNDLPAGRSKLEVVEQGSLVHRLSTWLNPEAQAFNSMFYYIVVGKSCAVDKVIIAVDLYTSTLKDYLDYMRGKSVYCNGVDIVQYNELKQKIDQEKSKKMLCVVVRTADEYNELTSELKKINKKYDTIVNIQKPAELDYAVLYRENIPAFIEERGKILNLNPQHSKFGFNMDQK